MVVTARHVAASAEFPDVPQDALADRLPQLHRYGIADQAAHRLTENLLPLSGELVATGKALKDRSLPQRECSVLLRMSEAAISESVKLGGHRRSEFIRVDGSTIVK